MKSILLSIRPEWVAKILNGEKTIEIRKKFTKDYVGWVYIYVSKNGNAIKDGLVYDDKGKGLVNKNLFPYAKGCPEHNRLLNGKVVARFWCDKVEEITWRFNGDEDIYSNDEDTLLEKSCLSHYELHNYLQRRLGYAIHISKLEVFDKPKELNSFHREFICGKEKESWIQIITKAPQNYCYVEGEEKMTSKQLVNHLCYEYGTRNFNEEKLKASQEIKKDLEVLEILKENFANFQQLSTELGIKQTIISFDIPTNKLKEIKEWLEN